MWLLVNVTQITHTHTHILIIYQTQITDQPKSYENMAPPQNQNVQNHDLPSFKRRLPTSVQKHRDNRWESFCDPGWLGGRPIFRCELLVVGRVPKKSHNDGVWKYTNCQRLSSTRDKRFSCWARERCNVGKKINQTCLTQEVYRIGFTPNSNRSTTVHGYDERGFKKMQIKTYVCNFAQRGIDSSTWLQRMH